jgi:hypothetical protein
VRGVAIFLAACVLVVLLLGLGLAQLFPGDANRHAIIVSGWIALGVQLLTFVAVRLSAPGRTMMMWGVGAVVRIATLIIYALVMLRPFGLPATAALISLATFFFATTLIEPRLLRV